MGWFSLISKLLVHNLFDGGCTGVIRPGRDSMYGAVRESNIQNRKVVVADTFSGAALFGEDDDILCLPKSDKSENNFISDDKALNTVILGCRSELQNELFVRSCFSLSKSSNLPTIVLHHGNRSLIDVFIQGTPNVPILDVCAINPFLESSSVEISHMITDALGDTDKDGFHTYNLLRLVCDIILAKGKTPSYSMFSKCPIDRLPNYIQSNLDGDIANDFLATYMMSSVAVSSLKNIFYEFDRGLTSRTYTQNMKLIELMASNKMFVIDVSTTSDIIANIFISYLKHIYKSHPFNIAIDISLPEGICLASTNSKQSILDYCNKTNYVVSTDKLRTFESGFGFNDSIDKLFISHLSDYESIGTICNWLSKYSKGIIESIPGMFGGKADFHVEYTTEYRVKPGTIAGMTGRQVCVWDRDSGFILFDDFLSDTIDEVIDIE